MFRRKTPTISYRELRSIARDEVLRVLHEDRETRALIARTGRASAKDWLGEILEVQSSWSAADLREMFRLALGLERPRLAPETRHLEFGASHLVFDGDSAYGQDEGTRNG